LTINRILKRYGLAGQRPYQRRGTPYPALAAQRPNQVHQLDLVGPRYLRGGKRFYGIQLMDAYSNAVALAAMPSKQAVDVVEAVWEIHAADRRRQLSRRFTLHRQGVPWGEGQVSFIRLTDDRGQVRFFSEAFLVDPALVHEYVKGTITTRAGVLTYFHQGHRVKRYPYIITKSFEAS
jgi:transposase InsO family protein